MMFGVPFVLYLGVSLINGVCRRWIGCVVHAQKQEQGYWLTLVAHKQYEAMRLWNWTSVNLKVCVCARGWVGGLCCAPRHINSQGIFEQRLASIDHRDFDFVFVFVLAAQSRTSACPFPTRPYPSR